MEKRILIPKKRAEYLRWILTHEPENESECFGEDLVLFYTADFGNSWLVDVKVCGVQFHEGEDNLPYTEAVLFHNGAEVCCTEPEDDIFGEWHLESDGMSFDVVVEEAENDDHGATH